MSAPKISKKREAVRAARAQQTRTSQIIGAVVIGLMVLGGLWIIFSRQTAQVAAPVENPVATPVVQENVSESASELEPAPIPTIKEYSAYPPMVIDQQKEYYATFEMHKGGTFVVQLYPDKAPLAVNNFVFLARDGYFTGVTFHRVLEGFMAQAGDQTGTGRGGPGYVFANEDSDLTFDKAGVVAMANAGRNTNGSQFFITFGATPHLNGGYTIFGQVIEGMDVVYQIRLRDPQLNPSYSGDVIKSVTIDEK
jgi:cyclophilin family peptidyl-prolyl cis-trans isomerase